MPLGATTSGRADASPTAPDERLPLLDAVRGMALGGILLANLTSFFGADMLDAASRATQPAAAVGRTVWIGGALGLAASAIYAAIKADARSTFILSGVGLAQTAAYTLGTTPLALAYVALAALAWQHDAWQRRLSWFVPLGRMALSGYLSQTLVQLLVFSAHGFGLAGRMPVALLPLVALAILVSQQRLCAWWLTTRAQGPVEWVWRRLAYGRGTEIRVA